MIQPKVLYYAKFEYDKESGETPIYVMTKFSGGYPPLEMMVGKRGRNRGKVFMYLMRKREQQPSDAPSMYLQTTGSYNFTGLKDCFTWSGTAYGYPNREPTYSSKKIPNPFLPYKDDGYLFLFHQEENLLYSKKGEVIPDSFELLILGKAKPLISSYCQQLQLGYFGAYLEQCRKIAISCADSDEAAKS